ncbi:hypothetical protein CONPUDRAFT_83017 [Coniophora puteana RWD-64-598 SS2]|uniref:SPIN90/Ldb17 leucine-rich domain-containing protein n=1 Tax=Coniophora puteana (strain RWD-64-598) TaxID=741705 RepID=A0A5M3MKB4_CONPW|nr:uncharacterized protein CONPUDRAFT_83017 [Coniophora puteana RWD-64-598 SS2]EIW79662.1 hypothetical protein CONPUDRAFT_83017 [Coniophora puteana RWD-64-598 SS2]
MAEDGFGIVYLIENAQQFWSELEDILRVPSDNTATLSMLDAALHRFVALCASYHEQFLQSPLQFEHACNLLLDSELFTFHSERMCELITEDIKSNTNPHSQLVLYFILLLYGRRQNNFLRSQKRWQPLIPLLMDHVLVAIDPDVEDVYVGNQSMSSMSSRMSISIGPIAIEAKLRSLGVKLLYEVCRVQKLSIQDLRVFDDSFINFLFDLVEETRFMPDETFNYSVIKLIVALNEQFMVAGLEPATKQNASSSQNRVMNILMSRLGESKTFAENLIFMLNRATRSAEDLCMQLLVLKLLYNLFTTKGTSEYFYTNDLCVLVDVFLRELVDLDEENESLRHTYLRVLNPLLTKTQLREYPYKRPQVVMALESLLSNANIRDINPTTKRLVERCLTGEWCVQLRKTTKDREFAGVHNNGGINGEFRQPSPSADVIAATSQDSVSSPGAVASEWGAASLPSFKSRQKAKSKRSLENLKRGVPSSAAPLVVRTAAPQENQRRPSADSVGGVATATAALSGMNLASGSSARRKDKGNSADDRVLRSDSSWLDAPLPPSPSALSLPPSSPTASRTHRRPAPAPPKRRKPPPVPVGKTHGGATITAIASSASTLKK